VGKQGRGEIISTLCLTVYGVIIYSNITTFTYHCKKAIYQLFIITVDTHMLNNKGNQLIEASLIFIASC